MRNVTRQDVVQALAVLGVRLSGALNANRFEEARALALDGHRALLLETHPDRHEAAGDSRRATARMQELSAAEHLVRRSPWIYVYHLFAGVRPPDPVGAAANPNWWRPSTQTSSSPRPGARFYVRCPLCFQLVGDGERHVCQVKVDHFNTRSRAYAYERPWKREPEVEPVYSSYSSSRTRTPIEPVCGDTSPQGVRCAEPKDHNGYHRGYSANGRHTWQEAKMYEVIEERTEETP